MNLFIYLKNVSCKSTMSNLNKKCLHISFMFKLCTEKMYVSSVEMLYWHLAVREHKCSFNEWINLYHILDGLQLTFASV